jgi:hypothetical protein
MINFSTVLIGVMWTLDELKEAGMADAVRTRL